MGKSTLHGSHMDTSAMRARSAFVALRGLGHERKRLGEIRRLPVVEWRGRKLYTLRCHGTTGRGPHDLNVPEYVLWTLIDLRAFHCPYHPR
jgi:hypothetical protein